MRWELLQLADGGKGAVPLTATNAGGGQALDDGWQGGDVANRREGRGGAGREGTS